MITEAEYIRQSLEVHLFFARAMKEHAIFLAAGFTPANQMLAQQALLYQMQYGMLLADTVSLANGVVSDAVLKSGEIVTPYTLDAETVTQYYTGIPIETGITQAELQLRGNGISPSPVLAQQVSALNMRAMQLTMAFIQYKGFLLANVLRCELFTANYPLLIDHVHREAEFYLKMTNRIQERQGMGNGREKLALAAEWNRIMAEHAKFIRGLLDPTQEELIEIANRFGKRFDALMKEARVALDTALPGDTVIRESRKATEEIRDFKRQATEGLLACEIRSIIVPLLADHVLREANYYLRILKG